MRAHEPSRTAAYVAGLRGLAALLPPEARLSDDPFGLDFSRPMARFAAAARRFPRVAARALAADHQLLSLQLRTRVLDDVLLGFAARGGRQVVLLGAGYDCRAARFPDELAGVTVYEVDHPATQAEKRRVLAESNAPSARVSYVPWNFEETPASDLPFHLAAVGHDHTQITLTIWEGVTMYLTAPTIEATVEAVRVLSAPGSTFAFTYFDRAAIDHPPLREKLVQAVVARLGEPFRFGFDPNDLPSFLGRHGFALLSDRTDGDLARELFPPRVARDYKGAMRHVAVAERGD